MTSAKLVFIVLLALPLLFSIGGTNAPTGTTGLTNLKSALTSLCSGLTSMLPVAAMLMTLLAAVIYASGQVMGAETRARANVWATAALTGAMMSVLITVISPSVLGAVYGGSITCDGSTTSTIPAGQEGGPCRPAEPRCNGLLTCQECDGEEICVREAACPD